MQPHPNAEKLERFAVLVQRQRQDEQERRYPNIVNPRRTRVILGKRYAKIDVDNGPESWSGCYMVDERGDIYGIKAYGVIHRGHYYGNLDTIFDWDWSGYTGRKLNARVTA